MNTDLPYVDEHAVRIAVPRQLAWTAVQRYVATSLRLADGHALARVLATEPPGGFEVADSTPGEHLSLVGRHRFARYMLTFDLTDAQDGATQLRAQTYAAFPGIGGRVYRALVIGTRAHLLATNHLLRSIRRLSHELAHERATAPRVR